MVTAPGSNAASETSDAHNSDGGHMMATGRRIQDLMVCSGVRNTGSDPGLMSEKIEKGNARPKLISATFVYVTKCNKTRS